MKFKIQAFKTALAGCCFSLFSLPGYSQSDLPYVLDMVHNNPGEKPYVTKYNDLVFLKSQGFTGAVPHWFVNCAIDYTNYTKKNILKKEERAWIDSLASRIDEKLATFHRAGIKVYPFTDFIVFPRSVWEKYKDEIVEDKNRRTHKPYLGNPRTRELLVAQIDGIFKRFPDLDGLTLRFGETYLHDAPFHVGGSPIRSGETGIEYMYLPCNASYRWKIELKLRCHERYGDIRTNDTAGRNIHRNAHSIMINLRIQLPYDLIATFSV